MKTISYKILWWSIALSLIPFLLGQKGAFDLQFHDTYFVIPLLHIAVISAIILGLLGLVYWILRYHQLIVVLSLIHSIITSMSIIGVSTLAFIQTTSSIPDFADRSQLNSIAVILILTLIFIQLVFIANLILGIIKGKTR